MLINRSSTLFLLSWTLTSRFFEKIRKNVGSRCHCIVISNLKPKSICFHIHKNFVECWDLLPKNAFLQFVIGKLLKLISVYFFVYRFDSFFCVYLFCFVCAFSLESLNVYQCVYDSSCKCVENEFNSKSTLTQLLFPSFSFFLSFFLLPKQAHTCDN